MSVGKTMFLFLFNLENAVMATATATKKKSSKNGSAARPVQEIRMGRIRAAIWENETTNGTRYNVTVSRIYKDGDTWKDSNSFGRDDLLIVAKVLDRCHTWIYSENGSAVVSNGEDGGEDAPF